MIVEEGWWLMRLFGDLCVGQVQAGGRSVDVAGFWPTYSVNDTDVELIRRLDLEELIP